MGLEGVYGCWCWVGEYWRCRYRRQEAIYSSTLTESMVKLNRGIQSWERKKKKRKGKGGISGFLATEKVTVLFPQDIGGVSTTIQDGVC